MLGLDKRAYWGLKNMLLSRGLNNTFVKISSICTLIIFLVGLFSFSSNEYESTCTIVRQRVVPRVKSDVFSQILSSFFSRENVTAGESLNPDLYSVIVERDDFLKDLMHSKFSFNGNDTTLSLYEFILRNNRLDVFLMKAQNRISDDIISHDGSLTQDELYCATFIKEHLSISNLPKSSVCLVTYRMNDQKAVAEIAYRAVELLQGYIEKMRLEKRNSDYEFALSQISETDSIYNIASNHLAIFNDAHHDIITIRALMDKRILLDHYQLAQENTLQSSKNYISAFVDLLEDISPAYVISKPTVPNSKSQIDIISLIFLSVIGGITIGTLFIPSKSSKHV